MKFIITILFLLTNYTLLISCSCSPISFCGLMEVSEEAVVFKGETLKVKNHDDRYHSAIIKVLTVIRGEHILTDTIELFGGNIDASCEANLQLTVGDINYFGSIVLNHSPIDVDQFEHESDNYWVSGFHQCFSAKLIIDGNFVKGRVSKEFDRYPLESFEKDLVDCTFSDQAFQKHLCPDFMVYPNPVKNNLFLSSTDDSRFIDELKIYNTAGQLLFDADPNQILDKDISLPNFDESLVVLEIKCGEERIFQKLVIMQ